MWSSSMIWGRVRQRSVILTTSQMDNGIKSLLTGILPCRLLFANCYFIFTQICLIRYKDENTCMCMNWNKFSENASDLHFPYRQYAWLCFIPKIGACHHVIHRWIVMKIMLPVTMPPCFDNNCGNMNSLITIYWYKIFFVKI